MNEVRLLAHYEQIADAPDAIARLRRSILDLAVRGKLVPQDPNDEPAWELLKRIATEKLQLVKTGAISRENTSKPADPDGLPFNIKPGWQAATIEQILIELQTGPFGSSLHQSDYQVGGVPVINPASIQNEQIVPIERMAVGAATLERLSTFKLRVGDIVMGRRGEMGRCAVVTEREAGWLCGTGSLILRLPRCVLGRFFVLLIGSPYVRDYLGGSAVGATMQNLNQGILLNLVVGLPPLAEQRRIVAKVDELMALCDRLEAARAARETMRDRLTVASLARLNAPDPDTFQADARFALKALPALTTRLDQIKQLRHTILNLAVRGKLLPQDPADEPASELLKRIAKEKAGIGVKHDVSPLGEGEIPFALPLGWSWSRIGEVCAKTGSGSTPRGGKEVYKDSGIPFLRSQNVYNDGLRLDDVAYIDQETHSRMSGTKVLPRDLLLNITGGSIGRCCRIPAEFKEANVSQHVAIIRTAVSGTEDFLHLLIRSPYFQAFVISEQTGAGRGGLPKNRMDQIVVALPPLAEQHRIVAKVGELTALCDRLEVSLSATTATRHRLLDALLAEALVPDGERELEAAE
jgi:type I restriction enzyme, S subunit